MVDTFPVDPQRAGRRVYIQNRPDSGVFEIYLFNQGRGVTGFRLDLIHCYVFTMLCYSALSAYTGEIFGLM